MTAGLTSQGCNVASAKVLLQDEDLGLKVPRGRVSHVLTPEASSKRAYNHLESSKWDERNAKERELLLAGCAYVVGSKHHSQ